MFTEREKNHSSQVSQNEVEILAKKDEVSGTGSSGEKIEIKGEEEKEDHANFQTVLENFPKEVDFNVLSNILGEICEKSGLNKREIKLITKFAEDTTDDLSGSRASFKTSPSRIEISEAAYYRTPKNCRKLQLLHDIVHEEIHAANKGILGNAGLDRFGNFSLINEAVTEKLALDITRQYIDKTSYMGGLEKIKEEFKTSEDQDKSVENFFNEKFGRYNKGRDWLDNFMIEISKYRDVNKEIVWGDLIVGAFNNKDLRKDAKFFDKIFYSGFTKKLSKAKSSKDLPIIPKTKED